MMSRLNKKLIRVVMLDDVEEINKIIGKADINKRCLDGTTILQLAVRYEKINAVSLLLDHGAKMFDPYRLLDLAIEKGNLNIVKLLVGHGASVNAHDKLHGEIPLFAAACNDKINIIHWLLDNGADVNWKNVDNQTILHTVLDYIGWYSESSDYMIELLLKAGVDVNVVDINCQTALHYAAMNGLLGAAKLLLKYGADINACDYTPLSHAVHYKKLPIKKLLIRNGGIIRTCSKRYSKLIEEVQMLLARDISTKQFDLNALLMLGRK